MLPNGEGPRSDHTVSAEWGYIGSGSTQSGPKQVASIEGSNVLRPVSALAARTELTGRHLPSGRRSQIPVGTSR